MHWTAAQTLDLVITRAKFKIQAVRGSAATIGSKRTAVVRIKSFSATTAADVAEAIAAARKGGRVDAVVLDLRGNVGGLLPGGVDTAKEFCECLRHWVQRCWLSGCNVLRQLTRRSFVCRAGTEVFCTVAQLADRASHVVFRVQMYVYRTSFQLVISSAVISLCLSIQCLLAATSSS